MKKERQIFSFRFIRKAVKQRAWNRFDGKTCRYSCKSIELQGIPGFNDLKINTRLELLYGKTKIRQMLREYLESGGFPGVVLSGEKKEQLSRYFEDIIYRDIADRHNIIKIDKLKSLGKYYLTNIASPTTFRKIADVIG